MHSRGSKNNLGYYITGNIRVAGSFFLYNLNDEDSSPRIIGENKDKISECVFDSFTPFEAICCDQAGYIIKYYFKSDFFSQTTSVFAYVSDAIQSCVQTKAGLILAGTSLGTYIFDLQGKNLWTLNPGAGKTISQIIEIRPWVVITVEAEEGIYVHDLTLIFNTSPSVVTIKIPGNDYFYSIIPLKLGGTGNFGATGANYGNTGGFIQISMLDSALGVDITKETGNLGGNNCRFTTLKEFEQGKLLIAGNNNCPILCIWNYITNHKPQCHDIVSTTSYIDLVKHC